jgi:hypothetical protein
MLIFMTNPNEPYRPKRQQRRHIYYKVQVFDKTSLTWRDEKDAFNALGDALLYIQRELQGVTSRIMVVDGKKRYPLPGHNEKL